MNTDPFSYMICAQPCSSVAVSSRDGVMPINRTRSHEAFQRACRLIPGGVNSPARAFGAVGGEPMFIARGEGPYLFDIDNNRYLDFIGSWGPLILGHAHPRVVAAVTEAMHQGA